MAVGTRGQTANGYPRSSSSSPSPLISSPPQVGCIIYASEVQNEDGWFLACVVLSTVMVCVHHILTGDEALSAWVVLGVGLLYSTMDSLFRITDVHADFNQDTAAAGGAIMIIGQLISFLGLLPLKQAGQIPAVAFAGIKNIVSTIAVLLQILAIILVLAATGGDNDRCCWVAPSIAIVTFIFAVCVYGDVESSNQLALFLCIVLQIQVFTVRENGHDTLAAGGIISWIATWAMIFVIILWVWPAMLGSGEGGPNVSLPTVNMPKMGGGGGNSSTSASSASSASSSSSSSSSS